MTEHNPKGTIRASRSGRRRAWVLAAVQLLMILHVVLWLSGAWGGKTVTPVEPSESMEFVKGGVINAGLIFFSVALLSTLILGRWFCGWGCHVVMLQDLCGWLMKKCGVRPKPFRSRLLIYVPLLLALYMFVWPLAFRWIAPASAWLAQHWSVIPNLGRVPEWPGLSTHLTTNEFWKTFPGVAIAIPFLLVCGFATVYFLGAKGFCTYGCPYGGFFAPLDKYAPGRIRVTDACEGCGHCTAVCTSNVRVHEEVREYGMVVDPGCMKCMDCVSVCPKEALYFGFGKPAVLKGAAKNQAPARKYDLTIGEEIVLALVFAVTFFSFRGDIVRLPLLMTAGVAGVITFLVWKVWRLARDPNVNLYRWQFKLRKKISWAGWTFAALVAVVAVVTIQSAVVNGAFLVAGRYDNQVLVHPQAVYSGEKFQAPAEIVAAADRAIGLYETSSSMSEGGFAWPTALQATIDIRLAWLYSVKGDLPRAERIVRQALERDGWSESFCSALALILRGQLKDQEAMDFYHEVLRQEVSYHQMFEEFMPWAVNGGAVNHAVNLCNARVQKDPNDIPTVRALATTLLFNLGALEQGVGVASHWTRLEPKNPLSHYALAYGLAGTGRLQDACGVMKTAVDLAPDNAEMNDVLARMLDDAGRALEAQHYHQRAAELRGKQTPATPAP